MKTLLLFFQLILLVALVAAQYDSEDDRIRESRDLKSSENSVNKLANDSSSLIQEMQTMFQTLSAKEDKLSQDMKELKAEVQSGISYLKKAERYNRLKRDKLESEEPFKACVYITNENSKSQPDEFNHKDAIVEEYKPLKAQPEPKNNEKFSINKIKAKALHDKGDIDFKSVYWIKFPQENGNGKIVFDKIYEVLKGIGAKSKDALIVPIKRYSSADDVTENFLKRIMKSSNDKNASTLIKSRKHRDLKINAIF